MRKYKNQESIAESRATSAQFWSNQLKPTFDKQVPVRAHSAWTQLSSGVELTLDYSSILVGLRKGSQTSRLVTRISKKAQLLTPSTRGA